MSDIVGGLRARLIRESLFRMIEDGLTELGRFASGPYLPITFIPKSQDTNEQIALNTLALADGDDLESDVEMGSTLTEQEWAMYVDFFAEDDALGLHIIKDVQDILRGRFTLSTSKSGPWFNVYDFREDIPPVLFQCEVINVTIDKAHGFTQPWLQHWYECAFQVVDFYDSES